MVVRDGNFELFQNDSLNKQLKIEYDNGTITNEDIHSEQFELKESLCSEGTLRFGCCETSSVKFKISNIFEPLKDKRLTLSMTIEGNREEPFTIGQYKVVSDVPTANRKYREVTAYDAMYDINNTEVSQWYNTLLPDKNSTTTLKAFRDSFFNYLGIEQEEAELPNDGMTIEKTIEPSELSGQTVITCICEINGCFGHIGRNGKFQYIFLEPIYKGLYPRDDLFPSNDIYPSDEHGTTKIRGSHYISAEYQDFETKTISRLIIRMEENDIGGGYGSGDNIYVIQDNFLVYGKSTADIDHIAELIMGKIDQIWYRPMSVYAKGNPGFEVGDGIRINTKREFLYTYILTRTLKGIQALKDTYEADGKEYQDQQVNNTRNSIIQLRGKANLLTRTVEENRLEVLDIAEGLSSRITQNAHEIDLRVTKNGVVAAINISPETITIAANKINVDGLLATTQFQAQTARITNLEVDHVSISDFNAAKARISSIESDYVTTGELNAVSARVGNLEADHVTTAQLNATNAKFNNLSANNITSGTIDGERVVINNARLHGSFASISGDFVWKNHNIGTATISGYTVLVYDD